MFQPPPSDYKCSAIRLVAAGGYQCIGLMRLRYHSPSPDTNYDYCEITSPLLICEKCGRVAAPEENIGYLAQPEPTSAE